MPKENIFRRIKHSMFSILNTIKDGINEIFPPLPSMYIEEEDQNCESNNNPIKFHEIEKRKEKKIEKKIHNTYTIYNSVDIINNTGNNTDTEYNTENKNNTEHINKCTENKQDTKNNEYLTDYKIFQLKNKIKSRKRTHTDNITTETTTKRRNTYGYIDSTLNTENTITKNNEELPKYKMIQLKNTIPSRKRTHTNDIITEKPTKRRQTYGYRESTLNTENTITKNNEELPKYKMIQLKNTIPSRKRTHTNDIITEKPTKRRQTYGYRESTLNTEITKNNQELPKLKIFQQKNTIQARKRTHTNDIATEKPSKRRNTYGHRDYKSTIQCNGKITDISLSESTKDHAAKKSTLKRRLGGAITPTKKRKIDDNNTLTKKCRVPSRQHFPKFKYGGNDLGSKTAFSKDSTINNTDGMINTKQYLQNIHERLNRPDKYRINMTKSEPNYISIIYHQPLRSKSAIGTPFWFNTCKTDQEPTKDYDELD